MLKIREKIKLENLLEHPNNPRRQLQTNDLVQSIKDSGQLVPLLVRLVEGRKYQILSGHRRKAALVELKRPYAECDILVDITEDQAYSVLMQTNVHSASLTEIEEAEGIKHMIDQFGWTQEQVAKEFGKSQDWVSLRLKLLTLDEPVREMLTNRFVNATQANYIARLPQDKQLEVAEKVKDEGLSKRETAEVVKQYTQPPAIEEPLTECEIHTPSNDEATNEPEIHASSNSLEIPDSTTEQPHNEMEIPSSQPESKETSDYGILQKRAPASNLMLTLKTLYREAQPIPYLMNSIIDFNREGEIVSAIEQNIEMLSKLLSAIKGDEKGIVIPFERKAKYPLDSYEELERRSDELTRQTRLMTNSVQSKFDTNN